jgi:predicted esterase
MFSETLFEICGHSYIALTLHGKTLHKIHVIHWPSCAEASEVILLRATNPCKSCEAHRREAGWIGAGDQDLIIPASEAQRLVELLRRPGADVTIRFANADHGLTNAEVKTAGHWLEELKP